ncbi:putative 2-aminoethylphosphonate ABC transporter ATP-binding protein [Clostridiaceae bacterium 14S0207]|nr:putative 2-aminoethylphosphonate ABC transporter ATP-binding protein [Clostridiaceae bacterium 14S0207]
MSFLTLRDISKSIKKKTILQNINLDIEQGEFIVLLGPSGCGKTTLLRIISGLEENFGGNIYLEDEDVTRLSSCKHNFGMVFQNYALFPNMTVEKNILYGLKNKKYSSIEIDKKIDNILEMVHMTENRKKYPSQLSGGQQQRVALARTLVLSPKVLFLDEPLSALDYNVRLSIREQIKNIQRQLKITTVMVTHDQEEALTMADKIAIIHNGKVTQFGTPEEIYMNPKDKYVAEFLGDLNIITEENNKIRCIRPEEIEYSFEVKNDYKKAIIKKVEFRGSFYRVIVNNEIYGKDIKMNVLYRDKIKVLNEEKIYIKLNNFLEIKV